MQFKNPVLNKIKDYVILTFGSLLFSFAWEVFVIPNNLTSGGLTGLCTIIQYSTDGLIPVSASYLVINMALIISAMFIFGSKFGLKTVYCILLTSVFFEVLPRIDWLPAIEGNFFYVPEIVLVPLIAGILEGAAVAIIMSVGGSTGGTDIITLVVNKYWPVSPGKVFLVTDLMVITSIIFLPEKNFSDAIYGYLMMITFSVVVDWFLLGPKSAVQVLIFSEKYKEIADFIIKQMDRGVTALNAIGWYTQNEKKVLLVVIRKKEFREMSKRIKEIDSRAFLSVGNVNEVLGEGFEEIKIGLKKKKNVES